MTGVFLHHAGALMQRVKRDGMKVSMKVDYGMRALVDLAMHERGRLIQTSEIAVRQGIPEPFLDQVLTTLRKAGLIRSRRGPQGGHALARPAGDISMADAVEALEGTYRSIECLGKGEEFCPRSGTCSHQDVWREVEEATWRILRAHNIGDLAARQSRMQGRTAIYHI
jgi:Rrf2 family protein